MRQCMLGVAVVLLAALVCTVALALEGSQPAPQYNPDPVAEFGTAKSEPINTGFFFFDGKYIEAPYVVERRGLDTYINDCLVRKGPEWPPYDYRVSEAPGDPPADESPLGPVPKGVDPRDSYWARKARFLWQHYGEEQGRQMLRDAYKASPAVAAISEDPETGRPRLTDKYGKTGVMDMMVPNVFLASPPTGAQVLKTAEHDREFMGGMLARRTAVVFMRGGTTIALQGETALKVLAVLTSSDSIDEKISGLRGIRVLTGSGRDDEEMFRSITFSPQLAERFQLVKEAETPAK